MRVVSIGTYLTPAEIQIDIGARLRALRLDRKLSQAEVAMRANVSVRALQNLEAGTGSTIETYIRVLKALGQLNTLDSLAPAVSAKPMELVRRRKPRQRAPKASKH